MPEWIIDRETVFRHEQIQLIEGLDKPNPQLTPPQLQLIVS